MIGRIFNGAGRQVAGLYGKARSTVGDDSRSFVSLR